MPGPVARALALCSVLAVLVTACTEAGPPGAASLPPATAGAAVTGGTLRVGQSADIATLDPWNATDAASLLVSRQIFETLVAHEPGGPRIVPRLATRWDSSPDGRTWTFTLRDGVRFHDGTALDAAAVVFNFERARDPSHPSRGRRGEFALFGARWTVDGEPLLIRVAALDPRTVVFTLRTAFGPFLADLANPAFAIVSPRSMQADPDGWMLPSSPAAAGTGPFRYVPGAWQRDHLIVLERNAAYWDADERGNPLPYLDRVSFRAVPDAASRTSELRSGGLDVVRDVSPHELGAVRASPNLALVPRPPQSVVYVGISHARPPLDLAEVRRAVALAINRQAIVQAAYAGDAKAASQLVPPGILGHDDTVTEFHRFDEAAAKKLLAEAGHARGFDTELSYPAPPRADEPDMRRIAEAIAADLARVGIKVQLRQVDPRRAPAAADEGPLSLGERVAASADPDELLAPWWDPQARALLQQARIEPRESKRAELYKQVAKMLQQQVARIPLFHPTRPLAASRKVQGLAAHAGGGEAFTRVTLGR